MQTGLLLIDIQNDYFPGGKMELEGSVEAGLAAGRLLAFFRKSGLPVAHVQHLSTRPGSTFFLPGTVGAEIHSSVRPLAGEKVIHKRFPNSFRETGLLELLRGQGVSRLVVAGMMTHMCVDATVRAAADLGFECLVAQEACATRALKLGGHSVSAADVHAAFLAALNGFYSRVETGDAILTEMRGGRV